MDEVRLCPICRVRMERINVRATKKMPWKQALECPECGWFEVDAFDLPQEVPPRG